MNQITVRGIAPEVEKQIRFSRKSTKAIAISGIIRSNTRGG